MRALDLDFARPPGPGRLRSALWLGFGAGALALVLWGLQRLDADVTRLAAQVDEAEHASRRERQPPRLAAADDEATRQALQRAQQVVAALNLGWGALFQRLEQLRQPGVTLLAVQREAGQGQGRRLRLSGEARRLDDALAYVSRLAASEGFANVHLIGHELQADGARQTVQFTLLADWVAPP
ncbi:MAG: PilN domain-containing protein [Rubrivivax sp.]